MPEKLHKSLMARAKEMGLKGEGKDPYVYGTLAKIEKERKDKTSPSSSR